MLANCWPPHPWYREELCQGQRIQRDRKTRSHSSHKDIQGRELHKSLLMWYPLECNWSTSSFCIERPRRHSQRRIVSKLHWTGNCSILQIEIRLVGICLKHHVLGFHIPRTESDPVFCEEQYCCDRAEVRVMVVPSMSVRESSSHRAPPRCMFFKVIMIEGP